MTKSLRSKRYRDRTSSAARVARVCDPTSSAARRLARYRDRTSSAARVARFRQQLQRQERREQ